MLDTHHEARSRAASNEARERSLRMERAEELAGEGYETARHLWAAVNAMQLPARLDRGMFERFLEAAIDEKPMSRSEAAVFKAAAIRFGCAKADEPRLDAELASAREAMMEGGR